MSNFMHKVKDAVSSHLHPQNKGSTNDSSAMENRVNDPLDTSRPSDMGDSTTRDPTMGDTMKTTGINDPTQSYGSTGAGMGDMGSGAYRDTTMSQNVESGGYGSGNMNTGSRLNEYRMGNEMNTPADTSLGNRGTYGGTTSTTDPGGYSSNYGAVGDNSMDSGANTGSANIANQTGDRSNLQDFGGAAAGGSSYNAPKTSGRRRSSGPHSSNLLNKLDPRVHKSDYEDATASNQRGI